MDVARPLSAGFRIALAAFTALFFPIRHVLKHNLLPVPKAIDSFPANKSPIPCLPNTHTISAHAPTTCRLPTPQGVSSAGHNAIACTTTAIKSLGPYSAIVDSFNKFPLIPFLVAFFLGIVTCVLLFWYAHCMERRRVADANTRNALSMVSLEDVYRYVDEFGKAKRWVEFVEGPGAGTGDVKTVSGSGSGKGDGSPTSLRSEGSGEKSDTMLTQKEKDERLEKRLARLEEQMDEEEIKRLEQSARRNGVDPDHVTDGEEADEQDKEGSFNEQAS